MPLVSVRIGRATSGISFTILLEKFSGTEYSKMALLLNQMAEMSMEGTKGGQNMEHSFVKMLLNLAQSPREGECLRVAIFKASGISASKARREYGFEGKEKRTAAVEESILEAQSIREAVENLAHPQDKALMEVYGIVDPADSTDTCSESDEEKEPTEDKTTQLSASTVSTLVTLLVQSHFNWFELQEKSMAVHEGRNEEVLSEFFKNTV